MNWKKETVCLSTAAMGMSRGRLNIDSSRRMIEHRMDSMSRKPQAILTEQASMTSCGAYHGFILTAHP